MMPTIWKKDYKISVYNIF